MAEPTPPRIYLAGRYSRREELCGYAKDLTAAGFEVTSTWLQGEHQISDQGTPIADDGEALVEAADEELRDKRAARLREHFAIEDAYDVIRSHALVAFTEEPRKHASRGGRHVELGIAIGRRLPIHIVGPRENIFCWLPEHQHPQQYPWHIGLWQFDSWIDAYHDLVHAYLDNGACWMAGCVRGRRHGALGDWALAMHRRAAADG